MVPVLKRLFVLVPSVLILLVGCAPAEEAAVPVDPKLKELQTQTHSNLPPEAQKAINGSAAGNETRQVPPKGN